MMIANACPVCQKGDGTSALDAIYNSLFCSKEHGFNRAEGGRSCRPDYLTTLNRVTYTTVKGMNI